MSQDHLLALVDSKQIAAGTRPRPIPVNRAGDTGFAFATRETLERVRR
ncbi:hypothetical protein [Acidovorax sp. CCYZU-2555]|nr:hypothetical protein [Acidovorax sp. CCYZU-2555]MBS7781294.1 hypothetical protein [Acidovorax sp. CCYZU-2555]